MTAPKEAVSAAPIPQGGMAAEIARMVQQLRNDANDEAADLIELLTDGGIAAEQDAIDHAAALAASEARVKCLSDGLASARVMTEAAEARVGEYMGIIERAGENWRYQFDRAEVAEQSLAAARKDAERLDWIALNGQAIRAVNNGHRNALVWGEAFPDYIGTCKSNLRAAIDALLPKGEGATS